MNEKDNSQSDVGRREVIKGTAAAGLIAATVFLDERYSAATWAGAGVIAVGIAITVWAQRTTDSPTARPRPRAPRT